MDWTPTRKIHWIWLAAVSVWLASGTCGVSIATAQPTLDAPVRPTRLLEFKSTDAQPAPTGNVRGEVVLELDGGSLLLLTEDGQLWTLDKDSIVSSIPSD